jgi:myo-inositol 2-dehydrogenase/D-chiro-inositol 1-dehydrogenase
MSQASDTTTATRRSFLRHSAAVAAGAATLSVAQGAHAAGNQTIRLGLIGCGSRGPGAALEYLKMGPDVQLVAMADLFADHLQAARKEIKERFPEQMKVDDNHCFVGFDGHKGVIDSCDLLAIACSTKFHPMYAEAGIKAGKHVFCEKPHGIDPKGVQRNRAMCELAKQKGRSFLSGLMSRHDVGWKETIQRIHDGAIGDVVAVQCRFLREPYVVRPRQAGWTEMQYEFRNWYHIFWLSGDDVPQSLVHNMDRMEWILKEEIPTSCFGLGGRAASFGDQYGDMYDHNTVVYEYPSGVRAYAMCRTQMNTPYFSDDIIMGTKGRCILDRCRIEGENKWQFKGARQSPYELEARYMLESIRNGQPVNSGYHCNNSTLITIMGQIACYTGQPVKWSEVNESTAGWGPDPEKAGFDMEPPIRPDATGNYPLPKPGFTKML